MSVGDAHPLDNAAWHALTGPHAAFAAAAGGARRYHDDVSPFFAVDRPDAAVWADVASLASRAHPAVLFRADPPEAPDGWRILARGRAHQMVLPPDATPADSASGIERLGPEHVDRMLALTALTKPGPFLPRTIELGAYHGVLDGDRLVAMAGERLHLDGYSEVSAVCTHPDAQGRGLAAALTRHVAAGIAARREQAFLHVADTNHTARRVYERLGFVTRTMVEFVVLSPPAPTNPEELP